MLYTTAESFCEAELTELADAPIFTTHPCVVLQEPFGDYCYSIE
ncbi:MAG: hypothetical protein ABIH42_09105 [Planctomycetota bacterium]